MRTGKPTEAFILDWLAASAGFSVLVELSAEEERCVRIKSMQAWPSGNEGTGEGSRALETLCRLADLHRIALCGDTPPYSKKVEDAVRMRVWLARFGFRPAEAEATKYELYRAPRQEMSLPPARA